MKGCLSDVVSLIGHAVKAGIAQELDTPQTEYDTVEHQSLAPLSKASWKGFPGQMEMWPLDLLLRLQTSLKHPHFGLFDQLLCASEGALLPFH